MLKPEEFYFSTGFRNFITAIFPYVRKPLYHFPSHCNDSRVSNQETVHSWFCRLIDEKLAGSVNACQVEDNMAVFASIAYNSKEITYANIQVLVAESDLESYYLGSPNAACQYFRIDYDLNNLGKMYAEPLGHIHVFPKGEPRFGQYQDVGNIILDFFDFIYRNHYHERWRDWAYFAYRNRMIRMNPEDDQFRPIEEAFKTNNHEALANAYAVHLGEVREACRAMKDSIFPGRINTRLAALLSY